MKVVQQELRPIFVCGRRTCFGKAGTGGFAPVRPDDLLVELLSSYETSKQGPASESIQDLIVGCAYPEGEQGYNVARTVALGCNWNVPGCTVNRLCASSLEAVAIAAARLASGWGDCYVVAGVESMSRIPRRGANFTESARIKNANRWAYVPNGDTAERVAKKFPHIRREQQEDFAARSHELADLAFREGKYRPQVFPFLIERDEFIRVPVNREKMASLPPAFDPQGVVTAATSSPLTDGATSGWVVSRQIAAGLGAVSGLEILDAQVAHVPAEEMGLGPVPATQMIFARHDLTPQDIAAYEINEAFAIQVLASIELLRIPVDRVNNWGGALAIGHPLGASGLRLVMTLHDRLTEIDQPGSLGLATLCVGGGQGMSMLFRHVKL
jgi:acetyl-CoA acyltransferase